MKRAWELSGEQAQIQPPHLCDGLFLLIYNCDEEEGRARTPRFCSPDPRLHPWLLG